MKHIRPAHIAVLVLALTGGCVRLGYDSQSPARNPKPDASHEDAGKVQNDGAISDAANGSDASGMDASKRDASMSDGGADGGKRDASMSDAATDAGTQDGGTSDSGMQDSGSSDSGPMDSGPEDAAPQDADVDSGPPPTKWCPERNDAVICDDFELNSLSRWEYPVITNGSVAITTARAHSGTHSFVAMTQTSGTPNSQARRGTTAFPHVTSGELWLRYFYFVPSSVSISNGFSTCPLAEIEMPYLGFALHIGSSDVEIRSLQNKYASLTPTPFPRDQWVCVEIRVVVDPVHGRFEAYVDDTLVVQKLEIDTLPDMGYSSVDIGIHYADGSQGPVTAYVDDVIAGYKRFGCN